MINSIVKISLIISVIYISNNRIFGEKTKNIFVLKRRW